MAKKLDWIVETAADEAALEQRLSELRLAGRGEQQVLYNGTDYTITYLAHHFHFATTSGTHIEWDIRSSMGYAPHVAPWSVLTTLNVDHPAENISMAAFQNNTFLMAYTTGWHRTPGTPFTENAFTKSDGPIYVQFGDKDGIVGTVIELATTSRFYPDVISLPNGMVLLTWIDTADNNAVKYCAFNQDGEFVQYYKTVGYTSGLSYAPRAVSLGDGTFMILYSELGHSHLQTVVYDAGYHEIERPPLETSVAFEGAQFDCELNGAGEVVMAYIVPFTKEFGYAVFNADGTLKTDVGAITSVGGAQALPTVNVLGSGNYLFSWYDGKVLHNGVYAIYNVANGVVKATATLGTDLKKTHSTIALANGGAAILTVPNAMYTGWKLSFYEADGTFEETVNLGSAGLYTPDLIGDSLIELSHGRIVACSSHFSALGKVSILQGS
jgi:hypothetical protein